MEYRYIDLCISRSRPLSLSVHIQQSRSVFFFYTDSQLGQILRTGHIGLQFRHLYPHNGRLIVGSSFQGLIQPFLLRNPKHFLNRIGQNYSSIRLHSHHNIQFSFFQTILHHQYIRFTDSSFFKPFIYNLIQFPYNLNELFRKLIQIAVCGHRPIADIGGINHVIHCMFYRQLSNSMLQFSYIILFPDSAPGIDILYQSGFYSIIIVFQVGSGQELHLLQLIGIVSGNIQFRKKARFNSFQGI